MKMITPLYYKFGFRCYGPLMHWSYIRTNHRSCPELKEVFRATTCTNGQGLELHCEEDIQRVVRLSRGRSAKSMQKAALGLNNSHIDSHHLLTARVAKVNRRWRHERDRTTDREAFDEAFHRQHDTFKYKKRIAPR